MFFHDCNNRFLCVYCIQRDHFANGPGLDQNFAYTVPDLEEVLIRATSLGESVGDQYLSARAQQKHDLFFR
jgi:hypothetical protein